MGKKVLACFGENLGRQEAFQQFAEQLGDKGFEVHLFDRVVDMGLKPHNVLNVFEHVWKERVEDNEYYFLTDIKDFFKLVYRVFHQTFEEFILWPDETAVYDVELEDIYAKLLSGEVLPEERLYKKIYVNDIATDLGEDFFNGQKAALSDFGQKRDMLPGQQVVYRFGGQCYLIEPSSGTTVYIKLDEQPVAEEIKYKDVIIPCDLDVGIFEQAEETLGFIALDYEVCLRRQDTVHKVFSLLRSEILSHGRVEQKYCCSLLEVMGEAYGVYAEIFSLSLLLHIYRESRFYKKMLAVCYNDSQLSLFNKYFVLMQSKHIELFDRMANADELLKAETALFQQIANGCEKVLAKEFVEIPKDTIDQNSIVIMTTQFLDYAQLQSRYALELARYLIKNMGKKVWLINTCELLTQNARIPFFDASASNIVGEYSNSNNIEIEEVRIPFYQMMSPMPDFGGIAGLLEFIQDIKPALIVNVSDLSVAAEICSRQTAGISMPPSGMKLFVSTGKTLVVDRELSESVKAVYAGAGVEVINVVGSLDPDGVQDPGMVGEVLQRLNLADR